MASRSATSDISLAPCSVGEEHEKYAPPPAAPVDLLRGHPSIYLLATAPFLAATTAVLGQPGEDLPQDSYSRTRHPLAYGPDDGNWNVRREIVRWQEDLYQQPATHVQQLSSSSSAQRVSKGGGEDTANVLLGGDDDPEPEARINITCGASFGLMSALQLCTSPCTGYTRRAFIIVPTYFWAGAIFVDAGFADLLTPIPYPPPKGRTMPEILLDALKADEQQGAPLNPPVGYEGGVKPLPSGRAAAGKPRGDGKRIYKYVLYCVPTYGNPTGTTWDLETRQKVVEIARDWDILVLCDDVYDFLPWGASNTGGVITSIASSSLSSLSPPQSPPPPPPPPPPRLVTLDRQLVLASSDASRQGAEEEDAGNVISNCSFSKLLGPGLRCGWQESSTPVLSRQLSQAGPNRSGGSPSHFVSTIIYELIRPQQQGRSDNSLRKNECGDRVTEDEWAEGESTGPGKRTRKIDAIIKGVALTLGARAAAVVDAVYTYLPPGSEILGYPPKEHAMAAATGKGGYFLWIAIGPDKSQPGAIDVREVLKLANQGELCTPHARGRDDEGKEPQQEDQQKGETGKTHAPQAVAAAQWINRVIIGHGDIFECPGKGPSGQPNWLGFGDRWIRVAISWCGAEAGVEGIRRLGRAVERWGLGERVVEVK